MALVKQNIECEIKAAFQSVMTQADDKREEALDKLAALLADAVIHAVKSMQITYQTGLTTSVGPVTGTFTYTVS